jgi:hypothetical protein
MFHYQLYIYIYAKTCNVDIYSLSSEVWVTSDGKYYDDPTKTMLSYFFRPSVGSSKNNRDGSYNNNTPSTRNDFNNTANYTNTNNRLIIIIT